MTIGPTRLLAAAMVAMTVGAGCGGPGPEPRAEGYLAVGDSTRLFYRVYGAGRDTAIVLHGGPGLPHDYLVPALQPLLVGRTLIFYDQRGRGRSTPADTVAITADSDVADLERVRRHFGIEHATLIGHHWGAAVAALYAVAYPAHVDRILMLSPFVVHPSFAFEFALLGARGSDRAGAVRGYRTIASAADAQAFCRDYLWWYFLPTPTDSPPVPPDVRREMCDAPGVDLRTGEGAKRAILRSLGSWSWRVPLHSVRAPVLVVEGVGPPIVQTASRRWAEHLPNARVLQLTTAPYLYPWFGRSRQFLQAVDTFLRGEWPANSIQPPPFEVQTTSSGARP